MNPAVLFIVSSDPRRSPRAAEAVRIAAGVAVWKKVDVRLCFHKAAVLALGEFAEELVDGDNFTRYLPLLGEAGQIVYVNRPAALPGELEQPLLKFQEIDDARLAALAAQCNYVVRF